MSVHETFLYPSYTAVFVKEKLSRAICSRYQGYWLKFCLVEFFTLGRVVIEDSVKTNCGIISTDYSYQLYNYVAAINKCVKGIQTILTGSDLRDANSTSFVNYRHRNYW